MTFDVWLREQMRLHRYNQPHLADALGVNQSTISNWLRGRSLPDTDRLVALSGLFMYDHLSLLEIVGIINVRGPSVPTGSEQQVVDRLRLLRGEPQHEELVQLFIQAVDIVLSAKDGFSREVSGEPKEERSDHNHK